MFRRVAMTCALLLSIPCHSQSKDAANDNATLPRIVKQTQLVYVPVVVDDKRGRTVSGLPREAIVIEQDGKEQNISLFEEVRSAGDFSNKAPAIAPGMVENFALSDTQARKSLIIIIDTLN